MFVPIYVGLVLLVVAQSYAPERGLFILDLSIPPQVEEWVGREVERVEKRCGEPASECWARELRQDERPLNPVHASPDSTAPVVGTLLAVLGHEDGWPQVRFDVRSLNGSRTVWLSADDIGDWSYGIEVIVRAKGTPFRSSAVWIQLTGVPGHAWIELKSPDTNASEMLMGRLRSVLGVVLSVAGDVKATNVRTGRRMSLSPQLNYVIERITGEHGVLRREVDSDSPCEDQSTRKVPEPSIPRYKVPINNLFPKDGKRILRTAYPRGC